MSKKTKEKRSSFANDVQGNSIYIGNAESGKKGYFCIECKTEKIAVKCKDRASYFRHVAKDIDIVRNCTYSDETFRHKRAKEILQNKKSIKVPALFKLPPQGIGEKNFIRSSQTITAHIVKIERQFYEDENGNINFCRKGEVEFGNEKHLLIQPDVAFFDENENPILLVEIVATHGIDEEKFSKIKNLGIDTIRVKIPKSSEEDIAAAFTSTKFTKWVYNNEQEKRNYIPVPTRNSTEIPQLDEFERQLLSKGESYECRVSELRNLIRKINKHLASEQYRGIEEKIRLDLLRTEDNSSKNRQQLHQIQDRIRGEVEDSFAEETAELKSEEKELARQEKKFWENSDDLEDRYNRKREDLESSIREPKSIYTERVEEIRKNIERLGASSTSFTEGSERNRYRRNEIERSYRDEIERIRDTEDRENENHQAEVSRIEDDTRMELLVTGEIKNEEAEGTGDIEQRKKYIREEFTGKMAGLPERFERERDEITRKYKQQERKLIEYSERGDIERLFSSSSRFQEILHGREYAKAILESSRELKRIRTLKNLLSTRDFKQRFQSIRS